ncbi:Myb-like dna-binding protein, partial [Globisporangium splendens]
MSLVSPARAFELAASTTNSDMEPKALDVVMHENDASTSAAEEEGDESENDGATVGTGVWTKEEHARFLEAIKIYANGPWKLVAAYVATRTVRQTMTHAQKYRQKAARRLRGLRTKQALMRMHYGHRISEESLIQERLRTLAAQVESPTSSPGPLYTPTSSAAARLHARTNKRDQVKKPRTSVSKKPSVASTASPLVSITTPAKPLPGSFQALLNMKIECGSPTETEKTPSTSVAAMAMDLDIIDDLSEAPSLEECAEMLYDLLCC